MIANFFIKNPSSYLTYRTDGWRVTFKSWYNQLTGDISSKLTLK